MNPAADNRPHVDPATTSIRLRRSWDAALEHTALLHPAGCHAALLDWQPARWPDEGGTPVEIAVPGWVWAGGRFAELCPRRGVSARLDMSLR